MALKALRVLDARLFEFFASQSVIAVAVVLVLVLVLVVLVPTHQVPNLRII